MTRLQPFYLPLDHRRLPTVPVRSTVQWCAFRVPTCVRTVAGVGDSTVTGNHSSPITHPVLGSLSRTENPMSRGEQYPHEGLTGTSGCQR